MNVRVGETRKKKKDFDVFNLVLFVYLLTLYDHDYLYHSRFRRESLVMIQYLKVQLFLQDSWSLIKSIYVNNSDGIIMAAIIMINQPSGFRSVLFGCDMGFARKIRSLSWPR